MTERIKIDMRHMGDLWRLPCITKAYKDEYDNTFLVYEDGTRRVRLSKGDVITHDTATGEWNVELSTPSMKFNGRYPTTTGVR